MPTRTDDPPRPRAPFEHLAESRSSDSTPVPSAETTPSVPRREPEPRRELELRQEPDLDEDDLLMEESFRSILSSHQRSGHWAPSDEIDVLAICGEVSLDFTRAELPPGGTIYIEARAICGEIQIVVPDGAQVELTGTPIIGSIEHQLRKKPARQAIREWVTGEREEDLQPPPSQQAHCFRIDARAICGVVKVLGR